MRRTPALLALLAVAGCEGNFLGGLAAPSPSTPQVDPSTQRLVCGDQRRPAATDLHRLTPAQYQHAVTDIFGGLVQPSGAYPPAFGKSVTGYSTEEALNAVGEQGATQLMRAAEAVALDVDAALGTLLPCSLDPSPGQPCFDAYLARYVRRAFRRAPTADEVAALQRVFDDALANDATFSEAVAVVTAAVLQSPQFLYVVEDAAGAGRPLTGVELASRLSFLLWDSVPDDELLDLAEAGALSSPEVLAAQARRMLDSPRADAALARYVREWTQTRSLLSSDKDHAQFPFFDAAYTKALDESFDRFAVAQFREGGTLESLFTSNAAYVDEALAPSYRVTAPPAGQWAKVAVDDTRYAGLTTHPLLLATNAHPSTSSWVFRGRTLQKRVLCTPMGAPPADAQTLLAAIQMPEDPTAREFSGAVNGNATCAGCHKVLDPPGLALEHFDAAGRYRETYADGRAIDTHGTLEGLPSGPLAFNSGVDLAAGLAARPELTSCAALQLFRFTFSRNETEADGCALQTVSDALDASGGDLSQALLAMTTTDSFTWRVDP